MSVHIQAVATDGHSAQVRFDVNGVKLIVRVVTGETPGSEVLVVFKGDDVEPLVSAGLTTGIVKAGWLFK